MYSLTHQLQKERVLAQDQVELHKKNLKIIQEETDNIKAALTDSADARKMLSEKLTELEIRSSTYLHQLQDQLKMTDELEQEVNELRKYKAAVEFGHSKEEEAIRIARAQYSYEDQAKVFYEALLMKKADLARINRQLRYKEIENEALETKVVALKKQLDSRNHRGESEKDLVVKSSIRTVKVDTISCPQKLASFPVTQEIVLDSRGFASGAYMARKINK